MKARILALTAALASLTVAAQAQMLLNIDFSNPSAATITSTGGAAAASSSGVSFRIQLLDFLAAPLPGPISFSLPTSGNLVNATGGIVYENTRVQSGFRHLYMQRFFGGASQSFVAGQTAFTGSNTVDMTSIAGVLPTAPFIGNIEVLDDFNSPTGVIIGQYQVTAVPEPATMTALALGAAALLRRKRNVSVKN